MFKQEALEVLRNRRAIRKFKPEQVSEEALAEILEAGKFAPTGGGTQGVKIIVVQVATEGAIVVVRKIAESSEGVVAAAPLKPYQPSQRMNTPSAPSGIEWPGIALTLTTLPPVSRTYLPMRGPRKIAPISAAMPPTMWMAQEPA